MSARSCRRPAAGGRGRCFLSGVPESKAAEHTLAHVCGGRVCLQKRAQCVPSPRGARGNATSHGKTPELWGLSSRSTRGGREGGRAGGRAGHQLRRGCWEATGQTTSESPRQVTSAPALPLGVLTRGQRTCPPSLARAKAASRRRPKLRRCLVYLKDRSFLPQPFLSPAESLWQDTFPLWHGNSGSCPGSASARRGWRTAGPSRRPEVRARGCRSQDTTGPQRPGAPVLE